jgi:DNA polymerase-3 subunit delta'
MTTLDDILGQEAAVAFLRQAHAADRLPHGLIFAGPVGVGKATTARALSWLFLCENPQGTSVCQQCPACTVFAAGNHPDFHIVYRQLIRLEKDVKARDLTIDVVRRYLLEPAARKPVLNMGKAFVVEEAELMNAAAQNALLKTLEEPYGRTLIILLTDQPNSLLQTIRSRCQMVRFASLDRSLVERELIARKIDPAMARDAAIIAEGSLGLSLRYIEDDIISRALELEQLLMRPTLDLADWFKQSADAYAEKQLERDPLASKDQMTREGIALYLKLAAQSFRRRLSQTEDPDQLEETCSAIDALVRAEEFLDSNVNIPLVLQQLTSTLSRQLA